MNASTLYDQCFDHMQTLALSGSFRGGFLVRGPDDTASASDSYGPFPLGDDWNITYTSGNTFVKPLLSMGSIPGLKLPTFTSFAVNISQSCSYSSQVLPESTKSTALVVNVTTFNNYGSRRAKAVLQLMKCDGTVVSSITKPGVYMVPGAYAIGVVKRISFVNEDEDTACKYGGAQVELLAAGLQEYCNVFTALPACKSGITNANDAPNSVTIVSQAPAPTTSSGLTNASETPVPTTSSAFKQNVVIATSVVSMVMLSALL